jgi:glycosyltransferase involved in cell wall biosynthesis
VPETILYLDHTAKWSGGEIALLRTLTALDRTRYTPLVVLAEEGPFADRLRERGVETLVLPLSEKIREVRKDSLKGPSAIFRQLGSLAALMGYAGRIARLARERKALVLHCNSLKSDMYGALAGRLAKVPVLWHVRDHIDPSYLPGPAVKVFRAMARSLPQYVVINSRSTLEKLAPESGGKESPRVTIVHDGLAEEELTTPAPTEYREWARTPVRIGLIGRITRWKGQHIFLQAARRVIAESPVPVQFVLAGGALFGENEYEAQIRELAAPLGDAVEMLGFRTDIPDVLRGLDILVHASITPEPFGQVVIEGMAEGLPVIATDGGGVQEIISHQNSGILVPMGEADALTGALLALLRDPAQAGRLAQAGHRAVRERFTAAHTARKLESIYDRIYPRSSENRPTGEKILDAATNGR